ncbi:MAG: phage recombination protein Bet [Pseudomonadota bacterium]
MNAATTYSASQLDVIKRTIAQDLEGFEFDLSVEQAKRSGLDPFRRQIFPLVFSKNNPQKRKVSIVTGIDGYRTLAERTGTYRPDEDEPTYEYDDEKKGPLNPLGIVSCKYVAYKHSHGDWFKVPGKVRWDEFAAIKTWNSESKLDGQWGKMPSLMIAKCAEAAALRRGWPDTFAGIYTEEEMDQARYADMNASQAIEQLAEDNRMKAIGGRDAVTLDWLDGQKLDRVPHGQLVDKVIGWCESDKQSSGDIEVFLNRNADELREFWAAKKSDALEMKGHIEAVVARKIEDENMNQDAA